VSSTVYSLAITVFEEGTVIAGISGIIFSLDLQETLLADCDISVFKF
jgi:hypothetical protein